MQEAFTTKSLQILTRTLMLFDLLVVIAAAVGAYWLAHGHLRVPGSHMTLLLVFSVMAVQFFRHRQLYDLDVFQRILPLIKPVAASWTLSFMLLMATLFVGGLTDEPTRFWVGEWYLFGMIGFVIGRAIFAAVRDNWKRNGRLTRRVALIGAGDIGQWLFNHLSFELRSPVEIVGVFDDRYDRYRDFKLPFNIRGKVEDIFDFIKEHPVEMIVVALPSEHEARINQIVQRLRMTPTEVHLCPGRIGYNLSKLEVIDLGGVPLLRIIKQPLGQWGWFAKMIEDYLIAATTLILLYPLFILIAIAIKLDSPGPVIFRQTRTGFSLKTFQMFKFRTMYCQPPAEGGRVDQAVVGDPRVTRVGKWLRRTSLDELPQVFNVLRGEMSMIGPRPHAVAHDDQFTQLIPAYVSRLRVKPGITGWAQVKGFRGLTDTREKLERRIEYDLYYIDNWSIWLDMKIIAMTFVFGMINKNAY